MTYRFYRIIFRMPPFVQCIGIKKNGVQCTNNGYFFENHCKIHHDVKYKNDAEYKARYDARPHHAAVPILRIEEPAPVRIVTATEPLRIVLTNSAPEPAPTLAPPPSEPSPAEIARMHAHKLKIYDHKLRTFTNPIPDNFVTYSTRLMTVWQRETIPGIDIPIAYAILRYCDITSPIQISLRNELLKDCIKLYLMSSGYHPLYNGYSSIPVDIRQSLLQHIHTKVSSFGIIDYRDIIPRTDSWWKIIRKREREEAERRRVEAEAAEAAAAAERRRQLQEDLRERPVVFRRDPEGSIDLAAFATDGQNIHRSSVQDATHKAVVKLMTRCLEAGQETLPEIIHDLKDPKKVRVTGSDTREKMITEITHDYFECIAFSIPYGDVMDRVWAFIRSHKDRAELFVRLAQEIAEGVGQCTNGKMARLVNVLQGFDDTLEVDPPKEVFQEKIALLMKRPVEERVEAARALFIEFSIPEAEQAPWLESLED